MADNGQGVDVVEEHLKAIQEIMDASLATLGVEELLDVILDRVVRILGADTSAVLLLEPEAGYLVARAARGLEEEVRQGVRIPLGRGFAGRVAADRRPVVIDRVDRTTVTNPILWGKGLRTMLGVPLLAATGVLGVMHVGRMEDRTFNDHDVELLQLAAERISGALQARITSTERTAAQLLQRSLLPAAFPACPDLEFAARYAPARGGQVGGDWYDAFMLPSGEVWLVAGDVAGHGLRTAAVMSKVRTTIRAYALEGHPPEEALRLADRTLVSFDSMEMATAICASIPPPYVDVRLASAGHLPPVLGDADGPARLVEIEPAPPLGSGLTTSVQSTTVRLPETCVLVVYTDGLVERRAESIDTGLQRLVGVVTCDDPEMVCAQIMDALVGLEPAEDDIALAAVRRT